MKKFWLILFLFSIGYNNLYATNLPDSINIIEEGYHQVLKFIEINERYKREGKLDSVKYMYVYVPGKEFNFYRTIDNQLNVLETSILDWVHDENDKLPTTAAEKLNFNLSFYNNKPVLNKGPDLEFGTADDFSELFQHYVVVVDGPKNFLNGKLHTIPDKVKWYSNGVVGGIINNIQDYEGRYEIFRQEFVDNFPLPSIFNPSAKNIIEFVFLNPQLKEVSGQKTGAVTSNKVNISLDLHTRQISDPHPVMDEIEDIIISQLPEVSVTEPALQGISRGLATFLDYIHEQIKIIHGDSIPLLAYTTCETFSAQLYYQYSRNWFEARCNLYPTNVNYQEYIRVTSLFLELVAFQGDEGDEIEGMLIADWVADKVNQYVASPNFAANASTSGHYLIWIVDHYNNTETWLNKWKGYVKTYYKYFVDTDQTDGNEIIAQAKSMFDILENKGIAWYKDFYYWTNPDKREEAVEDAWDEFHEGINYLTTGAYPQSIKDEMFNLLTSKHEVLWDHVLLPLPRSGKGPFQGEEVQILWTGVNSMEMGVAVANFVMSYYAEYMPNKLNVNDENFNNYIPFIEHSTLYTPNIPPYGWATGWVTPVYLAMDYELTGRNMAFNYCVQGGFVGNSRFNCDEGILSLAVTLKDFQGPSHDMFDIVYNLYTDGKSYIAGCPNCMENKAYKEPAFFTALKIENKDFDRHIEQVSAAILVATLPFSAGAAGVGTFMEFVYLGGAVSQANFAILNTVGTQNTQEYLKSYYGDVKGQAYYDNFITVNNVLAFGAMAGGAYQLGKTTVGTMRALSQHLDDLHASPGFADQVIFSSDDLVITRKGTNKFEKDFKTAFGEGEIDNLIYNARSGMYEVQGITPQQMLGPELSGLREVMDVARHNIAKIPSPPPPAQPFQPAHYISTSLNELVATNKLIPYANDLKSIGGGFSQFFNNSTSVATFNRKVNCYNRLSPYSQAIRTNVANLEILFADAQLTKALLNGFNGFTDNVTSLANAEGLTYNEFYTICGKHFDDLSVIERAQINNIRDQIPALNSGTILQKVIQKGTIQNYLDGTYNQIGGFISTGKDTKHLITYDDIYYGMRLDYSGSPFAISDGSCGVIRYTTPNASTAIIPKSPSNGGNETSPFPFTGHGFTSGNNGRLGVPEWKTGFLTPDNGAELWEVFSDGTEILRAKFISEANKFIEVP